CEYQRGCEEAPGQRERDSPGVRVQGFGAAKHSDRPVRGGRAGGLDPALRGHHGQGETMRLGDLRFIDCNFVDCDAFTPRTSAAEIVALLEQHEGEFIDVNTREKHPDPLKSAREDPDGRLSACAVSLRHPALQPDVYDYAHAAEKGYDPLSRPGAGGLSYFPQTRSATLHQSVSFPDEDPAKVERAATGLLQFLHYFAPLLRPAYAFIKPVIDAQFDP